jgi:integrase
VATSGLFRWSVEQEEQNAKLQSRGRRWVDNPARKVSARDKAIRVRVLTPDEVIRLLRCAEPYQEAYLRSFLHLGLRHGELTHTRLGVDLDVNAWIWEISNDHPPDERCSCAPCRDTGWSTKNKNAPRTIHVPDEPAAIRASIKRYLNLFPAQPGDCVFRNPRTGRPWVDRSLHEDFSALCERAGVPYGEKVRNGVVIHSLRHTCATQLLRSDVEISYVADLLGDKIDTIKKYYLHLNPHDLGSAVRKGPRYDV